MTTSTRILSFTPDLSTLEQLKSHSHTLEAFGKKLEEKQKLIRSSEQLFAARKSDWEAAQDLSEEIRANNRGLIVLSEGFPEAVFRATRSLFPPKIFSTDTFPVKIMSSSRSIESLERLGQSLEKQNVSLMLAFHDAPSPRLIWCFRLLLAYLGKDRNPDELKRRVFVATGEPTSAWERWAQESGFRTLAYPHRGAGRYLFFSEPNALVTNLLGVQAWRCVEGGRSFIRQYDKMGELDDPVFAYSSLREVQLTEHHRETLVLPDDSFDGFGRWWHLMTEETRSIFSEETFDGVIWTGRVMEGVLSPNRRHWVTEIAHDTPAKMPTPELANNPPSEHARGKGQQWEEIEKSYDRVVSAHRCGEGFAQPGVRVGLRRGDPFCSGGLMAFFESVVCTCHRLAEIGEESALTQPYRLEGTPA